LSSIRVGIVGCGQVGEELLSLLDGDSQISVASILVKDTTKARKYNKYLYTNSVSEFFDSGFDVFIDVSSDHISSFYLLEISLAAGCDAILCNKELLWTSSEKILELSNAYGSEILLSSIVSCSADYSRPVDTLSIDNIGDYSPEELYIYRGGGPKETALDIYTDITKLIEMPH